MLSVAHWRFVAVKFNVPLCGRSEHLDRFLDKTQGHLDSLKPLSSAKMHSSKLGELLSVSVCET